MDGATCPGAVKTSRDGQYWDACGAEEKTCDIPGETGAPIVSEGIKDTTHECQCKQPWDYHGITEYGCAMTADAAEPWCFVEDKEECLGKGGQLSSSVEGEVWDTCPMGEETDHCCHCEATWSYDGE